MKEAVYFNVQDTSHPHRRQNYEKSQRKGQSSQKNLPTPSPLWKIIAVILVIICLALILVLGYVLAMWTPKSYWTEEYSGNISSSIEANEIDCKYHACSINWHQYRENCYYFAREMRSWKECKRFCKDLSSSFLKLDVEEEMNFVLKFSKMQCDMQNEKFSISLYYNSKRLKWVWLDGTDLTLNKIEIPEFESANEKCMFIKYGKRVAEDCQTESYCICKKTVYSESVK